MDIVESFNSYFDLLPSAPDVEMTVTQYSRDDEEIQTLTGTFKTVFSEIEHFEDYYYRVTKFGFHESQKRIYTNYFGVKTSSIGGLSLTEEGFANSFLNHMVQCLSRCIQAGNKTFQKYYTFGEVIGHIYWYRDKITLLGQNDRIEFNNELNRFLKRYRSFRRVINLNDLAEVNGIYLLVLDKYNSCYIGQSDNMRKRIMRHWSRNDCFTGTGIDMFKCEDTTQIYAAYTKDWSRTNQLERNAISAFSPQFTINCLSGGDTEYISSQGGSIMKQEAGENRFSDNPFVDFYKEQAEFCKRIEKGKTEFLV